MTTAEIIKQIREADKGLKVLARGVKEAQKVYHEKEAEWKEAAKAKWALNQKLDKDSPFQVGDKVNVSKAILVGSAFTGNWQDAQGFISSVKCWLLKDGSVEFQYKVKKIKKDGTMSEKYLRYKTDDYMASQLTKIK